MGITEGCRRVDLKAKISSRGCIERLGVTRSDEKSFLTIAGDAEYSRHSNEGAIEYLGNNEKEQNKEKCKLSHGNCRG